MTLVLAVLLLAASPKLEQGQKAFSEGQFDAALKALDAAAAEERDPATLEKLHLLRGQCFAARQDFGRAEAAFDLALEANPEASLDPGKVDPAVVKLLESMRARSSGTVVFRSTPAGARVSLDGAELGLAPGQTTTVIGRHKLEAKWADDQLARVEVMVRSKRETFVELVLLEHEKIVEVKVPVEVQAKPVEPEKPPERFARPYVAVRGVMDVNAGPEGGLDLGAGVDFKYLSIGAYLRPYRYFYIVPRVAGLWPIFDLLTAYLQAEVDIRPSRLGVAIGGSIGAELYPQRWLGVFAEVGGKYFFVNQGFVVDTRFVLAAGVRARLP